jgi:hypothetical protein
VVIFLLPKVRPNFMHNILALVLALFMLLSNSTNITAILKKASPFDILLILYTIAISLAYDD